MLRVLIVGDDAIEIEQMRAAAHAAVGPMPGDGDVVVRRCAGAPGAQHLDEGLYLRPLPDRLIVVGRPHSCSTDDLVALGRMLDLRQDLAAITTGGDLGPSVDDVVTFGGAFHGGLLCQAGGFFGDGRLSLHDRLARLGHATAVLPLPDLRGASRLRLLSA